MARTNTRQWKTVLLFIVTSAIALILYLQTANPGVYGGDTAEFQRVAFTLDLPHPTGYPLYILLGHAWITACPFGSVAAKMNLLSGVFAALTVGMVLVLVYRVTRRVVAAALAGLMLAVTSGFWSQAVIAEIYTLHTLLVSGILLTLLWSRPSRASLLPLTAFLVGLGLAHHRMVILLLPGIVAYILCERLYKDLSLRWAAAIVIAFVLGLSPYLLTYIRGDWPTFRAFLGYVLHSGSQWFSFKKLPEHFATIIWPLLQQQMGVAGLLVGMVGLVYSYWRIEPRSCGTVLLFGISWLLAIVFLTVYRVGDIFAFFPHLQVINAILMGFGLAELLLWLKGLRPLVKKPWLVESVIWIMVAAVVVVHGRDSWQANDVSQERYIDERSLVILDHVQSNSLLVTGWSTGQALRYQQEIEGFRKDLEIVIDDVPSARKVQGYLNAGHPAYFWGAEWLDLIDEADYQIVFAEHQVDRRRLFRVTPIDSLPGGTPFQEAVHQPVTADLLLDSYQIRPWPLEADGLAELTLCWSGNTELLRDRTLVFRVDTEHDWVSHEFEVGDTSNAASCSAHYFILPPAPFSESASGAIQVLQKDRSEPEAEVGMESLAITPGDQVSPERIMLKSTPSLELIADGARLIGMSNDAVTSPGISFPVDAYWMVLAEANPGPGVQLELHDASGTTVDRQVWNLPAPSLSGGGPKSAIYAARYWLKVPRRAEPGIYTVHIGAVGSTEMMHATLIEVEEPERIWRRPSIANSVAYEFANGHILLEGYELTGSAQSIDLTLYWKSVEPVEENWKVFVHIVDQAGTIVAQNDSFPGKGLRWTDTWKPGEYVLDQHSILLPEALGSSEYAIIVGMYNPDTGMRVPTRAAPGGKDIVDAVRLPSIPAR